MYTTKRRPDGLLLFPDKIQAPQIMVSPLHLLQRNGGLVPCRSVHTQLARARIILQQCRQAPTDRAHTREPDGSAEQNVPARVGCRGAHRPEDVGLLSDIHMCGAVQRCPRAGLAFKAVIIKELNFTTLRTPLLTMVLGFYITSFA